MSAAGRNLNADESSAFFANNDASSYNTRYLKSIRNKERFQELHFYHCNIGLIDDLFPKQALKGTLDPPVASRASAVALNQWRELTQEEQLSVLQKEKQAEEQSRKEEAASSELKRSLEAQGEQATVAPSQPKVAKTEEGATSILDRWTIASTELDVDFSKDRTCDGISLDFLRKSYPTEGAKIEGFASLVGDAMQYRAHTYKNGHSWPFALDPRVLGAIVEQQLSADSATTVVQLKWVCKSADVGTGTNSNKLEFVNFHHPTCISNSPSILCENCKANCIDLVSLCGASVP